MVSRLELRIQVIRRDGGCIAPRLDPHVDSCRNQWGNPDSWAVAVSLQLDRIREHPTTGKAPDYDLYHCVAVCPHHHLGGWATSHRPAIREYLRGLYPDPVTTEEELFEGHRGAG